MLTLPGSNGSCFVRRDIRRDICVTNDILVELSVPLRISMLIYGYPWRVVELSVLARVSKTTDILVDIHTNTGAQTVRRGFE